MIIWLLIASLFCVGNGHRKKSDIYPCGPLDVVLTSPDQKSSVLLTWRDNSSCSRGQDHLTYKLVLFADGKEVHQDDIVVEPDQIQSITVWNVTLAVPLNCTMLSTKLETPHQNRINPKEECYTLPLNSKDPLVRPLSRMFEDGSTATFYCIIPEDDSFKDMYVDTIPNVNGNITKVTDRIHAFTVKLKKPEYTSSCISIVCESEKNPETSEYGSCAVISHPPDISDLRCETQDLESVECVWKEKPGDQSYSDRTSYFLNNNSCRPKEPCIKKTEETVGENNWTLRAVNQLGQVELSQRVDLAKTVRMYPPGEPHAPIVNARNASLKWKWTARKYKYLNITCQLNISDGHRYTITERSGIHLRDAVLTELIPDTTYTGKLRCGTAKHFWKWSEWSGFEFHTKGDVPDVLDVWIQRQNDGYMILWKPLLSNQTNGYIIGYSVMWAEVGTLEPQQKLVRHSDLNFTIELDPKKKYNVSVTARNLNGSSSPAFINIPITEKGHCFGHNVTENCCLNASRIKGSKNVFNLSWTANPAADCGYIVEWYSPYRNNGIDWLKVPNGQTTAIISPKNKHVAGTRYCLLVYACTGGTPLLIDRRQGYVKEKRMDENLFRPNILDQSKSKVLVTWEAIDPSRQTAFIQGYKLTCLALNITAQTDDPTETKLELGGIAAGTYDFTLTARTAVGECGDTLMTISMKDDSSGFLVNVIIIFFALTLGLIPVIFLLLVKNWICIKEKVYPTIPIPVILGKWPPPLEERKRELFTMQSSSMEGDGKDVPGQCHISVAPKNGKILPEKIPLVFPVQIPTHTFASHTYTNYCPSYKDENCIWNNPTYNLLITGDEQSNSEIQDFQEGKCTEESSGALHNLLKQAEESSKVSLYCDPNYIVLPNASE